MTTHLRNEKGQLLPGQPALPGAGRPPVAEAVRKEVNAILQGAVPGAAAKLAELCRHKDPRIALAASEIILTRVFGKPLQQVEARVETTNVQAAHLQILLELQAKRDKATQTIDAAPSREAETVELVEAPAPAPADDDDDDDDDGAGSAAQRAWRRRKSATAGAR